MGTIAEKLTYLNTTKSKIRDSINLTGANLTSEDTFRSYASKLNKGYIDIINNGIDTLYNNFPKVSGIGSNLSLTPTYEAPMKLNEIQGDTLQDGTPTPDTPVEIQNVTGLQNITVCGKNLLDLSKCINGYINASGGIGTGNDNLLSDYIKVESGTSYTISLNTQFQNIGYALFDSNKTYISRQNNKKKTTLTIIIPSGTSYIRVWFTLTNGTALTPTNILQYEPMIEEGIATEYESYKGNTYEVNLGTIELNKIGDYQDRIYKDSGKWYVEKNIGKVVLDGSEGWGLVSTYTNNTRFSSSSLILSKTTILMSNYFVEGKGGTDTPNIDTNGTTGQLMITIPTSIASTLSQFITWLSTNKPEILYQLDTPTYTEITNTELIEDLETLYTAKSQDGTTNISITSEDLEMILNVSALKSE
jgi:hypothetical protein